MELYTNENKIVPISYIDNDDLIKINHNNYKINKI